MGGKSRTDIETIGFSLVHPRAGSGDEAFTPSSGIVSSLPHNRISTAGRRQGCVIAGVEPDAGATNVVVVVYGYTPIMGRARTEDRHTGQWLRRVLAFATGTIGDAEIEADAKVPNMVLAESFVDSDESANPYSDFIVGQFGRGVTVHNDGNDGVGEVGIGEFGNITELSVHAWAMSGASEPSGAAAWAFVVLGD